MLKSKYVYTFILTFLFICLLFPKKIQAAEQLIYSKDGINISMNIEAADEEYETLYVPMKVTNNTKSEAILEFINLEVYDVFNNLIGSGTFRYTAPARSASNTTMILRGTGLTKETLGNIKYNVLSSVNLEGSLISEEPIIVNQNSGDITEDTTKEYEEKLESILKEQEETEKKEQEDENSKYKYAGYETEPVTDVMIGDRDHGLLYIVPDDEWEKINISDDETQLHYISKKLGLMVTLSYDLKTKDVDLFTETLKTYLTSGYNGEYIIINDDCIKFHDYIANRLYYCSPDSSELAYLLAIESADGMIKIMTVENILIENDQTDISNIVENKFISNWEPSIARKEATEKTKEIQEKIDNNEIISFGEGGEIQKEKTIMDYIKEYQTYLLIGLGVIVFITIIFIIMFIKAHQSWWKVFIPIYNLIIFSRIVWGDSVSWVGILVPIYNIYWHFRTCIDISKDFNFGKVFGIISAICPIALIIPILFGKYVGYCDVTEKHELIYLDLD